MSDRFFGESTRNARRWHFCDYCSNYVEPGMVYRRHIWVTQRGNLHVMKEHVAPSCPPNEGELHAQEMMEEERAALGVPVVMEVKQKAVLVMRVDGSVATEYILETTPLVAPPEIEIVHDSDSDEEIPF